MSHLEIIPEPGKVAHWRNQMILGGNILIKWIDTPPLPQETNTSGITSKTDKRIVVSGISGLWTLRAETNSRMWKKLENPEANCLNFISA